MAEPALAALVQAPAREQLRAIAAREVGAEELLDATLARALAVDQAVRAIVHLDEAGARTAARAADRALARGSAPGPLHGLPFSVKDWIDVAGMPCTGGAVEHRQRVASVDATVVARLRAAGAYPFAKTNPGERTAAFGPTFNPHDTSRTPTGSSSGEAALIAAGGSPLGLGSDSGGSLRQPAHACGVVAFRPSSALVPVTGHFPVITPLLDPRTVVGPLARSVGDVALALSVLAGPDGIDPSCLPLPLGDPGGITVRGVRVAYWTEQPDCQPEEAIVAAVERAAAALADAGAEIVQDRPQGLDMVYPITRTYWSLPESADADVWRPTATTTLDAEAVQRFRFEWEALRRALTRFFARYDAVLTPAAGSSAVLHGEPTGSIAPTLTFSLGGQCALVLPFGRTGQGMPVGVQVAAGVGRDALALALGAELERRDGGPWPVVTPSPAVSAPDRRS